MAGMQQKQQGQWWPLGSMLVATESCHVTSAVFLVACGSSSFPAHFPHFPASLDSVRTHILLQTVRTQVYCGQPRTLKVIEGKGGTEAEREERMDVRLLMRSCRITQGAQTGAL